MEKKFKGLTAQQKYAALEQLGFKPKTQQVILPLIGASQKVREYREELLKASGATKEVADKQDQSFSASLRMLRGNLDTAAIGFGEIIIKEGNLVELTKDLSNWINNLDDDTKKQIINRK